VVEGWARREPRNARVTDPKRLQLHGSGLDRTRGPVANLSNIPKGKVLRRTGQVGKIHVDGNNRLVFSQGSPQELFEQKGLADTPQSEQGDVLRRAAVERLAIVRQFCQFALTVREKTLLVERVKIVHV